MSSSTDSPSQHGSRMDDHANVSGVHRALLHHDEGALSTPLQQQIVITDTEEEAASYQCWEERLGALDLEGFGTGDDSSSLETRLNPNAPAFIPQWRVQV